MSERKGFFGFFKGLNKEISDEEAKQRDYAMSQERETDSGNNRDRSEFRQDEAPQIATEIVDYCRDQLAAVLTGAGYEAEVRVARIAGDCLFLDVKSGPDLGRVIGRDGGHLEALQTLVRAFVFQKYQSPIKVILDAGGYRKKRRNTLKNKALDAAKQVMTSGESVSLEPMNSADRRMIHMLFENDDKIASSSEGSGRSRYVVLAVK